MQGRVVLSAGKSRDYAGGRRPSTTEAVPGHICVWMSERGRVWMDESDCVNFSVALCGYTSTYFSDLFTWSNASIAPTPPALQLDAMADLRAGKLIAGVRLTFAQPDLRLIAYVCITLGHFDCRR